MSEGFVDLRGSHLDSESFWPSFTDIMMVIVIIFLLTSMLLMVKNWELLDQLRSSMAAEEQAEQIIHDTSRENVTLEEQLQYAQGEIAMLRMRMMQMDEHSIQLATELEKKEKQIINVLSEKAQLSNTIANNDNTITRLSSQISNMDNKLSKLSLDLDNQQEQLEQEQQNNRIIIQERDKQTQRLSVLEDDFGTLKVKYDKLIKPARSTKGKYIVAVDYERINGKERIRFKDSGDSKYSLVTEQQLHKKLAKLKKKYPKKLYIRIIIPEKSGLTYNEAWSFMLGLLRKYDYYYQQ